MTVKVGNIRKYQPMPAGMALNLVGEQRRRVRLEVNCEDDTRFDVVSEGGAVTFLAKVSGHSVIEFVVDGPCQVQPTSEGGVWLATDEGPHLVYETDEPSFVTLDFERHELTHIERLQAIANLKREQRDAETQALLDDLRAERAALEAVKNEQAQDGSGHNNGGAGTPPPSGDGKSEPEGEGATGQSGPDASGAGGPSKPVK